MTKKTVKKKKAAKAGGYATKKALKRSVLAEPVSATDVEFVPTPGYDAPFEDDMPAAKLDGMDYALLVLIAVVGFAFGYYFLS